MKNKNLEALLETLHKKQNITRKYQLVPQNISSKNIGQSIKDISEGKE